MRLWDTRTRARVASFRVHEDFVADVHFSEKRNSLLTASGDGTLALLDLRANKVAARSDNQEDELLSGACLLAVCVCSMHARLLHCLAKDETLGCDASCGRWAHNIYA